MSRSRRILNMVKEDENSAGFGAPFAEIPSFIARQSVNAVAIIEEYEKAVSPLPPGAEEISLELCGIWENILHDDQECNGSSRSNVDSAQSVQEIDNNNELTPFSLEVPPSFECSPMMEIEQFSNMELSIPTPLPSPLNVHSNCNDEFCPNHGNGFSTISSPLINSPSSPATSQSSSNTTPRTTKKRQRHQKEWSDVKRKCLKNLGQKYVTKTGKIMDEKTLGPTCKCRYKCKDKISHQQRVDCFTKFWQLGDRAKQWNFIIKYSDKMKKKRCLNQDVPNNRKYTYKYYLPLISGSNVQSHCKKVDVCQTMFINTLAVTTRILKTAWKKYDGSTIVEEDQRGRHENHKTIITDSMIQSVCDHVRAFAPVESHYIRKNSQKLYLPGDLSIAKMHKLYLEWFDAEKYTCKASKERQYRDIVNSNFNLGFHIPKKDQCDECHVFRLKKNPTEDEKIAFEEHEKYKRTARNLKGQDKKAAMDSNNKILTAVFDFQKVLSCPHGDINIFYYKRKLSCFNFTVFDMGKKKAVCYMWDETVAKRGANEVSSCLLDFIQANVEEGVKEFRFWSDNCAGQNRNRIVYSLYVYAAKKFNISITHRFLQKGHTQNEGDSVHSVIERASQTKTIYTPDEWRLLARWAKNEGESYAVRNMTRNDVFDFKCHINNKVWLKNIKGAKIAWNKIKEVHADSSDPNKLFYKYDLTQNECDILVLGGNTRHSLQTELKVAYSGHLKLPCAKYKDLVSMCQSNVIPSEYHAYFKSLPHHDSNAKTSDDSDDDALE